jgi:cobalt-precorrin-5B (C1)-methyltransferase
MSEAESEFDGEKPAGPLRPGWTTGACAAAAAKAAFTALATGDFPDPVSISLPRGERPAFALARHRLLDGETAIASVIKDAGDDPDVTHGAEVTATLRLLPAGSGVRFAAGPGVGTITRAGLPLPPGEPAINPVPRQIITTALAEVSAETGFPADVEVEISIPGGEKIARHTLNGRLGILGGLSILGTTGIVVPYSCSAWIHSIHRGIDVALAAGLTHIAGATGRTSEDAVATHHALPEIALIDMGDFVGGMLKYLRHHPVARVTIAGGVGKITKLAQGLLDLHSRRGAVDLPALAAIARETGGDEGLVAAITGANNAAEAFTLAGNAGIALADAVARKARAVALDVVEGAGIDIELLVYDRQGRLVGSAPFGNG